ncbi:MAG TPA: hypothetical protein VED24_00695 [Candidatus Acidoferrum sp.]|nr:hypothetical protein [Candidatus Acidoferrum sp.]
MTPRTRRSLWVSIVAVLAALHIVLSYFPPLFGFRRMSIAMEPMEGIIAGPYLGFLTATIGWIGGRFIRPDSYWIENLFGVAEAAGALGAGFLVSRKWYLTAGIYAALLLAFLAHPLTRQIPLWTLWDTYLGFIAVFPAAFFVRRIGDDKSNASRLIPAMALVTFASVELDVMVRVFMLTVVGLYRLYPIPVALLPAVFITGAFQTPLEAVFSVMASTLVGVPALIALEKGKILSWPLS